MIVKETYQQYKKRKDCIFVLISEKKNKENIALCESKKFGKGCFKPSGHSHSNFCPGFLINHVGMSESTE